MVYPGGGNSDIVGICGAALGIGRRLPGPRQGELPPADLLNPSAFPGALRNPGERLPAGEIGPPGGMIIPGAEFSEVHPLSRLTLGWQTLRGFS